MICETYHVPVMLRETMEGLNIRPGGVYVDVTFGGGGHSREVLRRMGGRGRLFSFDQDADAARNADSFGAMSPFTFVHSNFRYLKNWMRYYDVDRIDGVIADLGVSSHHFDDEGRGFSFRFDAPLDMRMNQRGGRTAADVVNTLSEKSLLDVLRLYGEVRQPQRVARAIVRAREKRPIETTGQLAEAVGGDKKELARVFQAIRIEVNGEMEALERMLLAAQELLADGGRLVVLTYHSLEDRIVKNVMRSGNVGGELVRDVFGNVSAPLKAIGKATPPSVEEQESNPRSRSAKLRVAEKRPLPEE